MIVTDEHRAAARKEHEDKPKMSAKDMERLRRAGEDERLHRDAERRFIEHFNALPHDTRTLAEVLKRIQAAPPLENAVAERRADKLRLAMHRGLKPMSVQDVSFLSELTKEEAAMSDEHFLTWLTQGWKQPPIVAPRPADAPPDLKMIPDGADTYPCANKHCGTGRSANGRVRGRVRAHGDFCCGACRRMVRAVSRRESKSSRYCPVSSEFCFNSRTESAG
jgi:hypothetical protein